MRIQRSQPVHESRVVQGFEVLVFPEHGAHSLARKQAYIWPPPMRIAVRGRVVKLVQEKESNNFNLRISKPGVGYYYCRYAWRSRDLDLRTYGKTDSPDSDYVRRYKARQWLRYASYYPGPGV